MTIRRAFAIVALPLLLIGCKSARLDAQLHRVGEGVNSASDLALRRCSPLEWADVTDHYAMALNDITGRRYRSAAHHLNIAEAQYAKALELVKSCPPGGRNPSFRVP